MGRIRPPLRPERNDFKKSGTERVKFEDVCSFLFLININIIYINIDNLIPIIDLSNLFYETLRSIRLL